MAIDLLNLQPVTPRVNIEDYSYLIYGKKKVGKTSLFHGMVKEKYGDASKGLLVGFEKGYQAIKGLYAQPVEDWDDFIELVDQLVENRDKVPYRLIAWDTVDIAYQMCSEYILKKRRLRDGEQYQDISDIGYGKGYKYVGNEMFAQVDRLMKSNYGIVFITHETDKKIKTRKGKEYDQTTVSLEKRAAELVQNMADFIVYIENVREKKNKEVVENRTIHFRSDGDIDAGSRFKDIRKSIDYDYKKFVEAIEEAIEISIGEGVDIEELKESQAKESEEKAKKYIENTKKHSELMPILTDLVKQTSKADKPKITDKFKEILGGTANYKNCKDAEKLQECIDFLNKFLSNNDDSDTSEEEEEE